MKIKFIKGHISGFREGDEREFQDAHAKRLISEGYCEEVKAKKPRKKKIEE